MTRDLVALGLANAALVAAGHGVLRLAGVRPAARDLAWSLAVAYLVGAAAFGVVGSAALVLGLALTWWQILLLCGALFLSGLLRGDVLRPGAGLRAQGWVRLLPLVVLGVLAVLAVDFVVQPVWMDDAWSIWAAKAESIVVLDGLDSGYLASASVFNASYPLLVPVLELVALRFCGLPNELIPLQLGLLFLAFPGALVAVLRDRVQPLLLWTVVLGLALAPTLQIHAAAALADVPLAVFLALGGVAGWRWVEDGQRSWLWLVAVFAAAAVNTKVEGAVFVAFLVVALGIAAARRGRALVVPTLVVAGVALSAAPWQLWSRRHSLGDAFSEAGGLSPGSLTRIPSAAGSMLRELADPSSWLAVVALALVAVVLAARRPDRRAAALFTLFVTVGSLVAMLAVYWLTSLDFDYHVATSVRRVIIAPVVFAAAMTPLLLTSARAQTSA